MAPLHGVTDFLGPTRDRRRQLCRKLAGYEARGKQDSATKATTATSVKTVDKKSVPHVDNAAQTGRQATMAGETVSSSK